MIQFELVGDAEQFFLRVKAALEEMAPGDQEMTNQNAASLLIGLAGSSVLSSYETRRAERQAVLN